MFQLSKFFALTVTSLILALGLVRCAKNDAGDPGDGDFVSRLESTRGFVPRLALSTGSPDVGASISAAATADPLWSQVFYYGGNWSQFSEFSAVWFRDLNRKWYIHLQCPATGPLFVAWVGQSDPCDPRHINSSFAQRQNSLDRLVAFDTALTQVGVEASSDRAKALFVKLLTEVRAFYNPTRPISYRHGWFWVNHGRALNDFWMHSARWGDLFSADGRVGVWNAEKKSVTVIFSAGTNESIGWYLFNALTEPVLQNAFTPTSQMSVVEHHHAKFESVYNNKYLSFGRGLTNATLRLRLVTPGHLSFGAEQNTDQEEANTVAPYLLGAADYHLAFHPPRGALWEALVYKNGVQGLSLKIEMGIGVHPTVQGTNGICSARLFSYPAVSGLSARIGGQTAERVAPDSLVFPCSTATQSLARLKVELVTTQGTVLASSWTSVLPSQPPPTSTKAIRFIGWEHAEFQPPNPAQILAGEIVAPTFRCALLTNAEVARLHGLPSPTNAIIAGAKNEQGFCRLAGANALAARRAQDLVPQHGFNLLLQEFANTLAFNPSFPLSEGWARNRGYFKSYQLTQPDFWLALGPDQIAIHSTGIYHYDSATRGFRMITWDTRQDPFVSSETDLSPYNLLAAVLNKRGTYRVFTAAHNPNAGNGRSDDILFYLSKAHEVSRVTLHTRTGSFPCMPRPLIPNGPFSCTVTPSGGLGSSATQAFYDEGKLAGPVWRAEVQWSSGAKQSVPVLRPGDGSRVLYLPAPARAGLFRLPTDYAGYTDLEIFVGSSRCLPPNGLVRFKAAEVGCYFPFNGTFGTHTVQIKYQGALLAHDTIQIVAHSDGALPTGLRPYGQSVFQAQGTRRVSYSHGECVFNNVSIGTPPQIVPYDGVCYTELPTQTNYPTETTARLETDWGAFNHSLAVPRIEPHRNVGANAFTLDGVTAISTMQGDAATKGSTYFPYSKPALLAEEYQQVPSCQSACNTMGMRWDASTENDSWCGTFLQKLWEPITARTRGASRLIYYGNGGQPGASCHHYGAENSYAVRAYYSPAADPLVLPSTTWLTKVCGCRTYQ